MVLVSMVSNRLIQYIRITTKTCWQRIDPVLVGIFLLGLILRLWGIGWGLPYTYASDEPTVIIIALRMIKTLDLNPHWWQWSPLIIYIIALVFTIFFSIGNALGRSPSLNDLPIPEVVTMGVGKMSLPDELLVARAVIAILSAITVILVYLLARHISSNRLVWFLAGSLMAVSPVIVEHSQRVAPDIPALCFLIGAVLFALRIFENPKTLNYIGAGIFAGLAIAAKYNTALVAICIVISHFMVFGVAGWRKKQLLLGLGLIPAVFLLVTPYSIIDFAGFWDGFKFNASAYLTGGRGEPGGDALQWYINYLWREAGFISTLGLLGLIHFVRIQLKKGVILIIFPILYFLLASQLYIRNERTIMLILPFLFLFGAILLGEVATKIRTALHLSRLSMSLGSSLLCILLLSPFLQRTWLSNIRLNQTDGRETARQWLETNLPYGTRVAVESYSPYLDTQHFVVIGLGAIIDRSIDWYIRNGFEYIVISQGMSGRFISNPQYYHNIVEKYEGLFSRFPLVARFNDNGYDIQIYKTDVVLPPHRVAARFGDNGGLVELVGYGDIEWKQGESLQFKLTWRTITEKPEPLEVEFRLIDQTDKEIAKTKSDLFQGKGWQQGMFEGLWTISIPSDMAPGSYRVQVDVDWTRYAYRTPAMNWAGEKIDPIIVGPFELKAK